VGQRFVAIAMARPGGQQLTDAIVSSVALDAGTRVEIVLQTSGYAPVEAKQLLARPSAPPEVWVGRAVITAPAVPGYRDGWN
jgi:hypothetical protein